MKWAVYALQRYAEFGGRSQRSEYWFFLLFYLLIFFGLAFLDMSTGMYNEQADIGLLSGIFALAMFIPSLAVTVRRLHDTGRSGWWLLINLIPFIGAIVTLVFLVQDSDGGTNAYGPSPKTGAAAA
jgi:uncharacterized membrane protein YhaH (DUF805 family)